MKLRNALSTLRVVSIAFGMIVAFGIPTFGQEAPLQNEASTPKPAPAMNEVLRHNIENWVLQGRGVPEDWSNHHLIFSNPGTEEEAIAKGTHDRWLKIVNDPRYILQQMKRSTGTKALADPQTASLGQAKTESTKKAKPTKGKLKKDWNEPLIANGQVQPNMYPAKFSFSSTIASCTADFVVYPTGVAGSGTAASIIAYSNLYTGGCTGTAPSVNWAYNTGGMVTTSPIISDDSTGSQVAFIQSNGTTASLVLLKWLQPPTGVTGTYPSGSTTVTITAGNVTTGDVGMQISGTGIPLNDTIVGVTVSESGTTVTLATATTLAETNEALTLMAGTVTTPLVPLSVSNAAYLACTAACMTTLAYANGKDDTFSAPFYDFTSDTLCVGDDDGYLHQFTGVFAGTPAESTTSPWPVQVNTTAGTKVSSPVYDSTSGYVFVGDSTGVLYSVAANGSTHGTSGVLGDTIIDGPLVDSTAGTVYAFVTTTTAGDNAVYQFPTSFTSGTGTSETTGFGGTGYYFYSGNFDNVYYSSTGGTAGDLWVVGNTGGSPGGAGGGVNLYQIPIGAGSAMSTPVAAITGLTNTSTGRYGWPSPITEFCNNGTSDCVASGTATTQGNDYLFFSVDRLATATTNCGTAGGDGCVLAYSINTPTNAPTLVGSAGVTTADTHGCWSTSAIEPDNSVPTGTLAGASNIYLLELNGNGAGGPTHARYTSSKCQNAAANAPSALQGAQTLP